MIIKKQKLNKGYSMAEIVVVLAILGVFIGVVGKFQKDYVGFSRVFNNELNLADDARKILRPMANEVRSMSPAANGAYAIESAATSSFVFFSDISGDAKTERVRYFLSGTTLKKGVKTASGNPSVYGTESITDVVSGIRNGSSAIFEYYDTNYTGSSTSTPLTYPMSTDSIRLVKITFIIDAIATDAISSTTVSTQVSLRNLKDNL